MKTRILIFCACAGICTSTLATLRPVATLSAGTDLISFNMNQNITIFAPFQNTYNTHIDVFDFVGGLFLGLESPITNHISGQLGISYYQNNDYNVTGSIFQFTDPTLNTMNYQYFIQSRRVYLETKILSTFQEKYHPYFSAGIGRAANEAHNYNEIPQETSGIPMVPGYGSHTTHSFTYLLGVGIEMDVTEHTRLGGTYRYSRLGNARLNTSPLEEGTQTLQNNAMHVNEFLLQLSYLG